MILLFVTVSFFVKFRFGEPDFEEGTYWYSEELDINFVINNGIMQGKTMINGKECNLIISTRSGRIDMFLNDDSIAENIVLSGKYKLSRNGIITIDQIKYFEYTEVDFDLERITLKKHLNNYSSR